MSCENALHKLKRTISKTPLRTTRLYIPDPIDTATINTGSTPVVTLDADDSRYLIKVMRYKEGDIVELFNGDGYSYQASIISAGKSTQLKIEAAQFNSTESPVSITLVQALAKGTKLDLVVQKATELGVSRITPVSSERTVLQVDEKRAQKKAEHWNKIARSASAQCNRSIVPEIDPLTALEKWLAIHKEEHSILIHPEAASSFNNLEPVAALNILVGPEGGFSDKELELAANAGVQSVKCGPRVLRTETAGFAAIAIVQSLIGDMC